MGLFRRSKKNKVSSSSGDATYEPRARESAYPLADNAQTAETASRDGVLSPKMAAGLSMPTHGGQVENDVSDAVDEIRAAADPEDDGAKETLIRNEREREERGR